MASWTEIENTIVVRFKKENRQESFPRNNVLRMVETWD
jgi:hypothetical protein